MTQLQDGNARYAAGQLQHPNQDAARRTAVASGQHPFATILTCSDSRLPVETLFDQGLGDLFVVRVAGNVAKTDEIGSIEYGTEHLGSRLLLVLGHTKCGAISAVVHKDKVGGSIPDLISPISTVVEQVRQAHPDFNDDAVIRQSVQDNVNASIAAILQGSEAIRELVKAGKLQVVGGVYDLETGKVEMKGQHPDQAKLLATAAAEKTEAPVAAAAEPAAATQTATAAAATTPVDDGSVGWVWYVATVALIGALIFLMRIFSRTAMASWTIGRRITAGFAAVLLILVGVGVYSYTTMTSTLDGFKEYRADARHSVLFGRIQANFLEMRISVKEFQINRKAAAVQSFQSRHQKVEEFIAEAKKEIHEPERVQTIASVEKELEAYLAEFGNMTTQPASASAAIGLRITEIGHRIDQQVEALKLSAIANQNAVGPVLQARLIRSQTFTLLICGAAVILGIASAYLIARSIIDPLLGISHNLMESTMQVTGAAGQVSRSSQNLAEGSSEQAASLEETSASLEEMSSMTKRNADAAQQARQTAGQARTTADTGAERMKAMQTAMDGIQSASTEISKILKTIDEIAFQTNILALNAAVEAARAGEAGAGFAVVAEEVRALAQRCANAARETGAKIDDSVQKSQHGVSISRDVAANFSAIQEEIRKLDLLVSEIANASQEQSTGITQVSTAMTQMDKVTQINAASSEETASAAEELNAQALVLKENMEGLGTLIGGTAARESQTTLAATAAPVAMAKPVTKGKSVTVKKALPPSAPARKSKSPALARSASGDSSHDEFFT